MPPKMPRYFDLETTGLLLPQAAPMVSQPYIVELCLIIDDANLYHTLVKPPIPIPAEVSRIHGITDEAVANAPTFSEIAGQVYQMMNGHTLRAYNASFDANVLRFEYQRLNHVAPVCHWQDPMHTAQMETGKRWKQADLYAALTGTKMVNAHSAKADTQALKIICEALDARRLRI